MEPKDVTPEGIDIKPVVKPEGNAVTTTDDKKGLTVLEEQLKQAQAKLLDEQNRADRNYARLKKAEDKLKERGVPFEEDQPPTPAKTPVRADVNPFSLAKTVTALNGLDEDEIGFLEVLSSAIQKSPIEARSSKEFELYLAGKRGETGKHNRYPTPKGGSVDFSMPSDADIAKMSLTELSALEKRYQDQKQNRGGV